jgi:putative heme-binding domain-containing protein
MDLIRLVTTGGPRARLAAAEALARCGGPDALPALWQGLTASPDRFLKHAIIHAAHKLASTEALQSALARPEPGVQAAAMLLLDQPPRPAGLLGPAVVVARLDSPDAGLRESALHILMRHPEWSEAAIDHIRGRIRAVDRSEKAALAEFVLAFQDRNDVQTLLAGAATGSEFAPERRAWALETIALSRLSPLPDAWVDALARSLQAVETPVRDAAVRAAAVFQDARLDASLIAFANAPAERPNLRLEALRAVMPRQPELSPIAFDLVIGRLGASEDPLSVLSAGELVGRARLSDAQRFQVLRAVRGQALITPTLLRGAFSAPVGDEAVTAWVDYVEQSLRDGWRPSDADLETLLGALPNLPVARRTELRNLHVEASRDRRALIVEHEPLLADGDPARGRAVFFGKAVACSACHRVVDEGGRVGPDLTRIGAIRSGRDLLESILWPSSTFAQGYESYSFATNDGRVLTGLIVRHDASVVLLRDSGGAETQLRRDELAEMRRSETSMMPEGLSRALTREEFRDLLAFLRSQN